MGAVAVEDPLRRQSQHEGRLSVDDFCFFFKQSELLELLVQVLSYLVSLEAVVTVVQVQRAYLPNAAPHVGPDFCRFLDVDGDRLLLFWPHLAFGVKNRRVARVEQERLSGEV